jgi:hypothetical protein
VGPNEVDTARKIFFLQLADAPTLPMAPLPWSRHHRCFPGQGSFDLAGFVADVIASGYCGPWSLEVFNDVFRQGDAERTARDGMRSLLTLEDSLASAAPQHVAFACRDIFAAARAAVARGTPMLPVPDNYHDDLAARFDLDPHLLGRLRAHGVLYDRDEGGGEFLHFYTATIGQRLSFEVTQRNGGYDGYGVPATHVRMAAQLRYAAPGGGYIG